MNVGDPVIYHRGRDGLSLFGVVKAVASHDGDCDIDLGDEPAALDVKMGQGPHTFEPLDFTPGWTIVHCPYCGHRNPSYFDTCLTCEQLSSSDELAADRLASGEQPSPGDGYRPDNPQEGRHE